MRVPWVLKELRNNIVYGTCERENTGSSSVLRVPRGLKRLIPTSPQGTWWYERAESHQLSGDLRAFKDCVPLLLRVKRG